MAGMYSDPGDKQGGTGLPEGHWMHGVMAKEKARLAKKKPAKGKQPMAAENPGPLKDSGGADGC